jgi:hypothetical protein
MQEYRYASLLRPLGSWVSLEQPFRIEDPKESDVDAFNPGWRAHDVLVTESPLDPEKIKSLQLTDIEESRNQKALCDKLYSMNLNHKYESMIKDELGDKIRECKVKTEDQLNRMIEKYKKYAQ